MRGIIADCQYSGNHNSLSLSTGINPLYLRQYLLYWDKIDYPSNNLIYVELSHEEKYLENIGILQRSHFNIHTQGYITINPDIFINCQIRALELNNSNNKGEIWTLGQNNSKLILPKEHAIKTNTAQLELYNCIPVPSEDTPFDDILDFKRKRRDELSALRDALDEMYDSILHSEFPQLQTNKCVEKLQNKIIDINQVMKESRIKRILSNVKVELNLLNLSTPILTACAGHMLGEKIGFPEIGTTVGLAASAISVSYAVSSKANSLPDTLKDYAYLFYAQREL